MPRGHHGEWTSLSLWFHAHVWGTDEDTAGVSLSAAVVSKKWP